MQKVKIVMIGPCKSGKTTISNFLSDAIEYVNDDYHPTHGLRILEYEIKNETVEAEVELWDCSGDQKFENVWPVFLWNAHGVVLVYDPEDNDQMQSLDVFYHHFITESMIPSSSCLIIAHFKDLESKHEIPDLGTSMSNVLQISANVLENGEELRNAFESFVSSLSHDVKNFDQDDVLMMF